MLQRLLRHLPPELAKHLFFLGPALILAVEVSGESGIVELIGAGSEHGYALLWVIIVALFYKFAFSNGLARYTVAKGENIFQGLKNIPGPRNWEVYFIMVIYIFEILAYGGILAFAAYFLGPLIPGLPSPEIIAIISLGLIILLLLRDSYESFERLIILMAGMLITGIFFTIFSLPIPGLEISTGLIPTIPEGSLVEIMALMGCIGGGLNLLLYSVWLHEKTGDTHGEDYFESHMKSVNLSLTIAFIVIGIASFVFMSLGFLAFAGNEMTGEESGILTAISDLMSTIPHGMTLFLLISFTTLFGAVMSGVDGRARAISSILKSSTNTRFSEITLYRLTILLFAVLISSTVFISNPHFLIRIVSAAASIMFAVLGFMLIYMDARLPAYARGSKTWLMVMVAGSVTFLLVALLKEETLIEFGIPLTERLAVVVIAVYLFSKTETIRGIITERNSVIDHVWIIAVFGLLSVYGTMRGINVDGFIVNFRDLGPIIAGVVGGPAVGAATGLIGGAYRYSLGGWTALPCSVATVVAGIIAGWCSYHWKGNITCLRAVIISVLVEVIHILIIIPILTYPVPFEQLLGVIRTTLLPMIVANTVGLTLFIAIINEHKIEIKKKN